MPFECAPMNFSFFIVFNRKPELRFKVLIKTFQAYSLDTLSNMEEKRPFLGTYICNSRVGKDILM